MKKNQVLSYSSVYEAVNILMEFEDGDAKIFTHSLWALPLKRENVRIGMNFNSMVKYLDNDKKAFRPTWKKGEFLWKEGNVLTHNTPYWGGEMINQFINGYVYVAIKEDIEANDWVVMEKSSKDSAVTS